MSDGLLTIDPEILNAWVKQFAPSDDEKKQARLEGILAAGLRLLGAQKGQEMPALGQAGLLGMQTSQDSLANSAKQRFMSLESAGKAMGLQEQLRKMQDSDVARKTMVDFYAGNGSPNGQASNQSASATAPQGGKQSKFDQYSAAAQALYAKGAIEAGDKLAATAERFRPKLKDTRTQTDPSTGQRVTVNYFDDGTTQVVPFSPDQEKLHMTDTGGGVLPTDPFTGKAAGAAIPKTQTPDSMASNQIAQGHLGIASAQLQLARESAARAAANEGKPQVITGPTGDVYTVDARTGTGRQVTGPDGQPLNKGEKPLTESQAKATAFANQMAQATTAINALESKGFTGATTMQQAGIANAGGGGIPYVPGSGAMQRGLSGDDAQKYHQAQLQWTEGALRFMTGANAPEPEVIRNAATYFPRTGDSAETIKQKAAARRNMEESVRMAAGQGNNKLPGLGDNVPTPTRVIRYDERGRRVP